MKLRQVIPTVTAIIVCVCVFGPPVSRSDGLKAQDHLASGVEKQKAGDLQGAIADYSAAIRKDPKLVDAWIARGDVKLDLGDYAGAIKDYDAALSLSPHTFVLYQRAYAKRQLGDLPGALADLDRAIKRYPEVLDAFIGRADVKLALGDLAGALADYDAAIRLDSSIPSLFNNRGNIKCDLGDYHGAIQDFNAAIRLDPKSPMPFLNRGETRRRMADPEGASEDFRRAVAVAGADPIAKYAQLFIWISTARDRKLDQAKRKIAAFITANPGEQWEDALLKFYAGFIDEKALLAAAASPDPQRDRELKCEADFYLGEYHLATGKASRAKAFFQKAVASKLYEFIEYRTARFELIGPVPVEEQPRPKK